MEDHKLERDQHTLGQEFMRAVEFITEKVGPNYLYHATDPASMMRILKTGYLKATDTPQAATKATTNLPTISTTRNKNHAESDMFIDMLNLTPEGNSVIMILDKNVIAQRYKMFPTSQGKQTYHSDEYEEAIVVPKGNMPLQGILKGFYFNPNRKNELESYKKMPWFQEVISSPYLFDVEQGVAEGSGFDQQAGIGIDGKSYKFKIRDLVAFAEKYPVTKVNPKEFIQQIKGRDEDPTQSMARAEKADLQYPIIVVQRKNGQLWIADGTHRAHKAILNKLPAINAKIIPIDDMESFEIKKVDEAPLPADWDKEKLNLRQTYKDRIKYVVDRAKRIGGGSSRVAVTIEHEGGPTVLKVAKNYKGLAQNEAEISILNDGYFSKLPIVIPLIDYDKENSRPVWLQTEVAKKVTAPTLMKLLHTPSMWLFNNKVRNILGRRKPHEIDDETIKRKYFETYNERWKPTEQDWDIFEEYANEVADLVGNSSLELGDLNAASNWGVYNDRPVIIDLGLSSEVWQKYYVQGKYRKNK